MTDQEYAPRSAIDDATRAHVIQDLQGMSIWVTVALVEGRIDLADISNLLSLMHELADS